MTTAMRKSVNVLTCQYTVATGQSVTKGEAVVLASDTTVQDAGGESDLAIGIARAAASAGAVVEIAMFGFAIEPVIVGTNGATRGKKAKAVATGFEDATTHDSDGTGNESTYGIFLESKTVGQYAGLLLCGVANRGV